MSKQLSIILKQSLHLPSFIQFLTEHQYHIVYSTSCLPVFILPFPWWFRTLSQQEMQKDPFFWSQKNDSKIQTSPICMFIVCIFHIRIREYQLKFDRCFLLLCFPFEPIRSFLELYNKYIAEIYNYIIQNLKFKIEIVFCWWTGSFGSLISILLFCLILKLVEYYVYVIKRKRIASMMKIGGCWWIGSKLL